MEVEATNSSHASESVPKDMVLGLHPRGFESSKSDQILHGKVGSAWVGKPMNYRLHSKRGRLKFRISVSACFMHI
jgi:hypothetical protein